MDYEGRPIKNFSFTMKFEMTNFDWKSKFEKNCKNTNIEFHYSCANILPFFTYVVKTQFKNLICGSGWDWCSKKTQYESHQMQTTLVINWIFRVKVFMSANRFFCNLFAWSFERTFLWRAVTSFSIQDVLHIVDCDEVQFWNFCFWSVQWAFKFNFCDFGSLGDEFIQYWAFRSFFMTNSKDFL